jgi:hypothetical protein
MLRELAKNIRTQSSAWQSPTWESPGGRVGTITSINGNGLYNVNIDGAVYNNIGAIASWSDDYYVGQSVQVIMQGDMPLIVSSP